MNADLARRALAIFEDALEIDPTQLEPWLAEACAADADLLAEVRRLLAADALAEAAMPTGGLRPDDAPMPKRIGHYRIVDRIGQGGMGDVFVAARDDGLFEHAVAIKRVRPSLFPATARDLFDRERRALASLSHRHIAQLYDGGVDETGAPYFIMELVRGAPIDRYVADRDLSPRAIVEKMIAVCEAVQHAHQNLIVHADLKPANILVNDAGDPKIVDFGVARLLREEDNTTLHPQTPGYASPEREAGASPTPADDVYALGAVLRTLLTGERPGTESATTLTSEAIAASPAFAVRPAIWRQNRRRVVQGDLDAIIARSCAPAAKNRYPAAVALAADLRAWLDIRPLAGRSTDRVYVFTRFLRRRRWRVIGATAVALALLTALSVTTMLWTQADAARKQAEARFTEVRSLAKYLLHDVYDRLERTPHSLAMRRDVARVAQGYLNQLADTPSAPAHVLLEAADGLVRIADLQAGRSRANLGEFDEAQHNLQRADAIAESLAGATPTPAVSTLRAGISIRLAALAMNSNQDLAAAATSLDRARTLIAVLPQADGPTRTLAARLELEAAILANWKGAYADGLSHAREAMTLAAALTIDPADTRQKQYLIARAHDALAEATYYGSGEAASEPEYRRLTEITAANLAADPEDMLGLRMAIEARWALGTTLVGMGRTSDGLAQLDIAAALVPSLLDYEPDDQGAVRTQQIVLAARAQALAMAGRFKEGIALLREQADTIAERANKSGQRPELMRSHAVTLAMLADLYAANDRPRDACPIYAEAESVFASLDARGVLSQLDKDASRRMVNESQARLCR